jgi:tetratricopeptide (TPR) repeat protein
VLLVDAITGNHVWAERYDRDLADIFAVQDEITERVVSAIEPELYAAEHIRSQRKPPDSLDAWECVIRALSGIGQVTRAATTEAEALCRRAIAIAPDYGQAHSLLAWTLMRRSVLSAGGFAAVLPETTAEVRMALGLDDRDPWAHLMQGILFLRLGRYGEAVRAHRRVLELNPNFALAHAVIGWMLTVEGANEEAVSSAEHALRLSPSDRLVGAYVSRAMAAAHFSAGRDAECAAWSRSQIEKFTEEPGAYWMLTAALAMQGDVEGAEAACAALLRLRPDFSLTWMAENLAIGKYRVRLWEGLRKAGVPEH